ncbi:MAG: PEP/pyruvate-binding domain-containing protein [bacterium]|nr:PEP/pyruvate-binding domain-containing protein [bacterium]
MIFIKDFNGIGKGDAAIAGGKGASLGEMTRAGIPVPPGFVLLSSAFEHFLDETNLHTEIDTILHTVKTDEMRSVEHASEKIQKLILEAKMPRGIGKEIQKFYNALCAEPVRRTSASDVGGFVAVRSSATAEDSNSAAWAGQLDTFLNTTEETLLENVQKCWASLFTSRAVFYRFEKELHQQKISVAVVVQKMIQSEISGIAFSVHPVTEDRNQLIIEAGWGLGEAIVSGQITPDSYVVEKDPRRIIDANIAIQERGIFRKPSTSSGSANEWREIPENKREKQKLSEMQILELAELVIKIEKHYGFPCDIEWAWEACPNAEGGRGKFYITQSRPITTLSSKPSKRRIHNT